MKILPPAPSKIIMDDIKDVMIFSDSAPRAMRRRYPKVYAVYLCFGTTKMIANTKSFCEAFAGASLQQQQRLMLMIPELLWLWDDRKFSKLLPSKALFEDEIAFAQL